MPLWRHSFQQPSRPLTRGRQLLPSPVPSHGMHAVTSEFMRSTHAPQVLTTTSLIVGRLLDAAGHRARRAGSTGCSGSSRQQRRECASRDLAMTHGWHAVPVATWSAAGVSERRTLATVRLYLTLLVLGSRVVRRRTAGASVGSVIQAFRKSDRSDDTLGWTPPGEPRHKVSGQWSIFELIGDTPFGRYT